MWNSRYRSGVGREARGGQVGGIETEGANGVEDRARTGARQCAGESTAADEGHAEAYAFFFGKADDFNALARRGSPRASTSAMPRTTPRMPSNAPALGTVSRCEPMTRRVVELRRANAAQIAGRIDTIRPCRARRIHAPSRRWTSCIGGERNVRVVRPGSSRATREIAAVLRSLCPPDALMIRDKCCSRGAPAAAARDSSLPRRRRRNGW